MHAPRWCSSTLSAHSHRSQTPGQSEPRCPGSDHAGQGLPQAATATVPCATSATAPAPPQQGEPRPRQGQRRQRFGKRAPGAATDAWLAKPAIPTAPSTFLMKTLKVKDRRAGLLYPA